jgi:cellulose synthase/poly-beta-1,6-N-acetylglucosamine synthase-like glycosyltransferase
LKTDGSFAWFDAVAEVLNDTMLRAAKSRVGLPIEISGSGALIRKEVFIDCINRLDPNAPGFDKNFMVNLLTRDCPIKSIYVPTAILREEKTEEADAFRTQRIRWFGEQYYNAIYSSEKLWRQLLFKGRFAALDYWLVLSRPPRSVLILALLLMTCLELALTLLSILVYPVCSVAFAVVGLASLGLLHKHNLTGGLRHHAFHFPKLFFSNLYSVSVSLRKKYLGTFISTEHKV